MQTTILVVLAGFQITRKFLVKSKLEKKTYENAVYSSSIPSSCIALKRLLKKKAETSDISNSPSRGKQRICQSSCSSSEAVQVYTGEQGRTIGQKIPFHTLSYGKQSCGLKARGSGLGWQLMVWDGIQAAERLQCPRAKTTAWAGHGFARSHLEGILENIIPGSAEICRPPSKVIVGRSARQKQRPF